MIIYDVFGPEYVLEVHDPKIGMRGFLVIDNTRLGPGKGGLRMTPDVSLDEVFRLARAMTLKNAIAGIPFGGAKSGIVWPPLPSSNLRSSQDLRLKRRFVDRFARMVKPLLVEKYIAGPDVNTGEREMRWFVEAAGNLKSATGKPADLCEKCSGKTCWGCGLPHELGSTGFGVAIAARAAASATGLDIRNARVAVEGFGNVGRFVFKHITDMGARVVAVGDSKGTAVNENGFTLETLDALKKKGKSVAEYPGASRFPRERIFTLNVDILVLATVTDVIHNRNKRDVKAKIIVEGANIPMSEDIEREFYRRGVLVLPDIVANAGGVISSYAEYAGYSPEKMFRMVRRKISASARAVLVESRRKKIPPRDAAIAIAKRKLAKKI